MNFNQATFIGRLTDEAKAITTTDKPFTAFTIAVNHRYTDRQEQVVEEVDFVSVTLNGVGRVPYLRKGDQVLVTGRVSAEAYEKGNGELGAALKLYADKFEFGESKKAPEPEAVPG